MRSRQLAVVAVALLAALSGCASLGGGGDAGGDGAELAAEGGSMAADTSGADDSPSDDAAESEGGESSYGAAATANAAGDRAIVRTGSVELSVENFDATRDAIAAEVRRFGGYVGGSSQTLHRSNNESWTTGQVVVRIPADRFSDVVSFAQAQGTVENVETETEDVTERLVELDARLENLEAKRSRLRSFYDRANSTSELLSIEERLSSVQGEIEQLEATRQSLEDRVSFSTLRISIAEEPPESEPTDQESGPTVASVFFDSVGQLVDGGYALVLAIAAFAPFAVVLGVPGVIGYGLYRRRRAGRSPQPPIERAPPNADDAPDESQGFEEEPKD